MHGGFEGVAIELELADLTAVDLDPRDALEVGGEEPVVGLDVDLVELGGALITEQLENLGSRVVAEMTARPGVEGDASHTLHRRI